VGFPETLLCATLLALPAAPARAQQAGDADRVQALYAQARYGEALDEAGRLADGVLAAEWRCYLYLAGGDYPAALHAALAGLSLQPDHRGLLVNAVTCALTLGLAEVASQRADELVQAVRSAGAGAAPAEVERAGRLAEAARELAQLEAAGTRGLALARSVVVALIAVVVGAMLLLARRPASARRPPISAG
jgi:hypothetical protein